jgi:hypothetical protein
VRAGAGGAGVCVLIFMLIIPVYGRESFQGR